MATITIKNIPDNVVVSLKQRAQQNRRSLNSELITILERATKLYPLPVDEILEEARRLREFTADHLLTATEVEQLINEGR